MLFLDVNIFEPAMAPVVVGLMILSQPIVYVLIALGVVAWVSYRVMRGPKW